MIRLYMGEMFDPLNPDPKSIKAPILAHSLSNLCRYGGHCETFYSIAQHVVLCARLIEKFYPASGEALEALHHDDSEGLGLVDMPRPVKHAPSMLGYRQIEDKVDRAVKIAFNLKEVTRWVKWADDQLLVNEMKVLAPLSYPVYSQKLRDQGIEEVEIEVAPWNSSTAKRIYLSTHERLTKERNENED
ncbi:MAG: hypothetical protein ACRYGG_00845 [Janthinobacterium lividum]